MIEIADLYAGYNGRQILNDVSVTIPDGKVTVLIGPNGSGKSTLFKTITGLLPSQGTLLIDGVQADAMTPRIRAQHVAYLSQSRNIPSITAYRLVLHGRFPYLQYPRRYRRQDEEIAHRALQTMEAEDLSDISLLKLSGGQRQRVYLAMALAQDTNNILMDEPTTYLDIHHQQEMMHTAADLALHGKTVCMVLHDLCLALKEADQIIVVNEGKICYSGTSEELYQTKIPQTIFDVKIDRFITDSGWQYFYAE